MLPEPDRAASWFTHGKMNTKHTWLVAAIRAITVVVVHLVEVDGLAAIEARKLAIHWLILLVICSPADDGASTGSTRQQAEQGQHQCYPAALHRDARQDGCVTANTGSWWSYYCISVQLQASYMSVSLSVMLLGFNPRARVHPSVLYHQLVKLAPLHTHQDLFVRRACRWVICPASFMIL